MKDYIIIVLHKLNGSFGYYRVSTGEKIKRVKTGDYPHEICLSPDRSKIYISEYGLRGVESPGIGGNTVAVFDVKTGNQISTINTGQYDRPHGIVAHKSGYLFVTSESTKHVLIFDIDSEKLIHAVQTDQELTHMVQVAPDGRTVYTANVGSGTLTHIDVQTGKVLGRIKVLHRPEGMAFSPDGKLLYVVNRESRTVAIVDIQKGQMVKQISTGHGPVRLVITPDGKRIIFSLFHSDAIEIADTEAGRVIKTIPVGMQPVGIAISPDGKYVFISCEYENTVYVISMESMSIVHKIKTENGCDSMVCIDIKEFGEINL
ncbi:beta-propeller fold lactonase family protein [candidate division KSB1 bacterium]|nr:beta-propeller fold lactonase family protein [candidate division KSB1 bacterium]